MPTTLPAFAYPPASLFARASGWRPAPLALLVVVALAASALAAAAILGATGMRIDPTGFVRFAILAFGLGAVAQWCAMRGIDRRMGAAAAIVATATLSLMLCGVVANAGLRLGMPLADARLAAADAVMGFDVGAVIRTVAQHPVLTRVLSLAYNGAGLAVVLLILTALLRKQVGRAWELAATAFVAMQIVAIVSPLAPAWGAMRHFALTGLQGHGLPAGAGIYQWPAFAHFHAGTDPVLRLTDMGGVVAFPSFHTVLALMLTQALGETRLRWPGIAASAVVILSTIPMGGHYVSDIAAGALVWLMSAILARRFSTPSA